MKYYIHLALMSEKCIWDVYNNLFENIYYSAVIRISNEFSYCSEHNIMYISVLYDKIHTKRQSFKCLIKNGFYIINKIIMSYF